MADVNFVTKSVICLQNKRGFDYVEHEYCERQMNDFLRFVSDTYDNVDCEKPVPILGGCGDASYTYGYTLMCSGTFKESVLAEGRKNAGQLMGQLALVILRPDLVIKSAFDAAMDFLGIK